jgi:anti-sigma factor ChrR (cupin superfamily)
VVLGKLAPGTHYPPHSHIGAEQNFVMSGDLHIVEVVLNEGEFHNAREGSNHGENYSESGCTIMAIVSTEDLATLMP